ncbi:unnamed protein product [Heligmosomoides polygyrus]|uniref:Uncharacterized protein n=1 Tax=Heligmosomoides polygyrus TaxID=6339 RepID=A0A183FFH3_HELPZ|nr:unnamed protein product [Heligmosomoides polygyrus]
MPGVDPAIDALNLKDGCDLFGSDHGKSVSLSSGATPVMKPPSSCEWLQGACKLVKPKEMSDTSVQSSRFEPLGVANSGEGDFISH